MKGIYLGACRAYHPTRDLDYNDIVSVYCIKYGDDMSKYNQGGYNVHNVFERFMDVISND